MKYFSQKPRIYKNFVTLSDPYWKLTRHSTYMYIFGEGVSKTHHFVHTLKIGHSTSFLRIYKSHYSLVGFVNSKPFPDLNPKVTDQPSFFLWPLSGAAQSKSKGTKSSLLNELIKFKNPFLLKFRYRKLFKVWISNSRGVISYLWGKICWFLARQLFWIGDPFYSFQNFQRVGMILHVK